MNDKIKNIGIGSILLTALGTVVFAFADFFAANIKIVIWVVIVAGFAVLSYFTSWCLTQAYKILYHDPKEWKTLPVRRLIYRCAMLTGFFSMLFCGVVFLLISGATWQLRVVIGALWLLSAVFVGASSPQVWRWCFEKAWPVMSKSILRRSKSSGGACQ